MDIVAGSEVSVENEAPQRDTAVENVKDQNDSNEEEASLSTPLVSENPCEEACDPEEASVSGMEVVGGLELPTVKEASLRSCPVEDLVSSTPMREFEKITDKVAEEERNYGKPDDGSVPACQEHENQSENKTSVPEPEYLASESKCPGMESPAGLGQCVEVETSTLQKLSEVEIETSENKSSNDGIAAEVHVNEDEEVDKAANELQHAAAAAQEGGTSEEEAVIQQLGGDDSKDATDVVVNPTASQTRDINDDLGGEKSEVATDSEANAAVSGAIDVMEGDNLKVGPDSETAPPQSREMKDDDLPSSPPDHSPKASEIASPPANEEKEVKTEQNYG